MEFTDVERAYIIDYLSGSQELKITPKVDRWLIPGGYTAVFRDRLFSIIQAASAKDLQSIEDIGRKTAERIIENKEKILEDIREWKNFETEIDRKTGSVKRRRFMALSNILKEKKYDRFTEFILRQNASILDAKVTVDVKRILRLPSSLHSKASLKCMLISNIESFDPLKEAVPKFVLERK
jgi:DNA primase small subunit